MYGQNDPLGRSLSNENVDFGAEITNTVGSWSLKGDIIPNANGSTLLDIASEFSLRHVSSHFNVRDSKRWTWKHPRYGTRAVLDHMFLPANKMRFISRYYVVQHLILHTDHRLTVCEVSFHPRDVKNARTPRIDKTSLQ